MGLISSTKTKIIKSVTTAITATQTFCNLLDAILASMGRIRSTLVDLQTQINNGQDNKKTKVDVDDCEGFLSDKIGSSDTIEVTVTPAVNGCKVIKLNVKAPATTGTGGTLPNPYADACETAWTSLESSGYATFTTPSTALDRVWQGNVQWSINKVGEVKVRGKLFVNAAMIIMTSNTIAQSPQTSSQKIFQLPSSNQCLVDKIGSTSDYYGVNQVTYVSMTNQVLITISLKRIGLEFWIDIQCVKNHLGEFAAGPANLEIGLGSLKSIS